MNANGSWLGRATCLLMLCLLTACGGGGSSGSSAPGAPGGGGGTPGTPGVLLLSWNAPTTNQDGSAPANVAGYRVYAALTGGTLAFVADLPATPTTNVPVSFVPPFASGNTIDIALTAFNTFGWESGRSNVFTATIP